MHCAAFICCLLAPTAFVYGDTLPSIAVDQNGVLKITAASTSVSDDLEVGRNLQVAGKLFVGSSVDVDSALNKCEVDSAALQDRFCLEAYKDYEKDAEAEVCMVQLQADDDVYLKSSTDYDNLCKKYGLRGYNTATSNNNCPDIGGTGPTITNNCNIGSMWGSFKAAEDLPYMKRAVWIAITRTNDANDLGIEWNEAGPCSEGSMAQDCGTSKLASRGLDHGKNPIYGNNYDIKNYNIGEGEFIACAVQKD
eukprot:gene3509-32420_t